MLLFYSIVIQLWSWEFIAVLWLAEWEAAEYRNFPFNVQLYDRKKIYILGFRPSLPNILKKRLVLLRHCTWFISMSSISDWVLCFGRNKCSILKGYFQPKVFTRVKKYIEDNFILSYRTRAIITRGLYTFYPLFEVHLCTVTFGLMYG